MSTWDDPPRQPGQPFYPTIIVGMHDDGLVRPEVVAEPPPRGRRVLVPVLLFVATCVSTFFAGGLEAVHTQWGIDQAMDLASRGEAEFVRTFVKGGMSFAGPLMFILLAHELGHFFQAHRYHVPASLPYFIPFPISPIGTMGAVIAMRGRIGDRKALYDIAITGPLAGLVPALVCCVIGLQWSTIGFREPHNGEPSLGYPLLFRVMASEYVGPLATGQDYSLHPVAFAGWVGIFITALNLIPIGQLDGGHILYALLRNKAHAVATFMLYGAVIAMVLTRNWGWSLMILLLILSGPRHPPTGDDYMPLGRFRIVLGWLTLLFILIGFTPEPFHFD